MRNGENCKPGFFASDRWIGVQTSEKIASQIFGFEAKQERGWKETEYKKREEEKNGKTKNNKTRSDGVQRVSRI